MLNAVRHTACVADRRVTRQLALVLGLVGVLVAPAQAASTSIPLPGGTLTFQCHNTGGLPAEPRKGSVPPETRIDQVPTGWPIECTVPRGWRRTNARYTWSHDSTVLAAGQGKYTLNATFAERGPKQLMLIVELGGTIRTASQTVTAEGWLIVALGDSVASGEGVPDKGSVLKAHWQDRRCHRSSRASPALIAKDIQNLNPGVPVTFVSLACSGATISKGVLGPYGGVEPGAREHPLEPQLDDLERIAKRRTIDAVVISVGANDVRFSKVILSCIPLLFNNKTARGCFHHRARRVSPSADPLEQVLHRMLDALPTGYAELAHRLALAHIAPSHVFLLQYFDPTRLTSSQTCSSILGIGKSVLEMAQRLLLTPLNEKGEAAADNFGWHYIDGVSAEFADHGYCAPRSWIVHLPHSLFTQGGGLRLRGIFARAGGVFHPSEEGARAIARLAEGEVCPSLDPPPASSYGRRCPVMIRRSVTDYSELALVIAAAVVLLILVLVGVIRAQQIVIARSAGTYTPPATAEGAPPARTARAGDLIPLNDRAAAEQAGIQTDAKTLRLLRGLVVGTDNRLSTSKTVVAVWTMAIFYGLLALLIARWLGDSTGWNKLIHHGLQDEYLLLLGGPYAAAVLAKYQASGDSTKTSAVPGSARPKDLIANDSGNTDLGDFQYVLFNLLTLGWYLSELIPHLHAGMPDMPSLLSGLALTSAGGYAAKKFVGQATPTLTSVVPSVVIRDEHEHVPAVAAWGTNLIIPSADGKSELPPTVIAGHLTATVTSVQRTVGSDQLSISLPDNVPNDQPLLVSVVRADGLPAAGPGGAGGLTVTVRSHGWHP
jgi:lysophospholipase L1-like esterase